MTDQQPSLTRRDFLFVFLGSPLAGTISTFILTRGLAVGTVLLYSWVSFLTLSMLMTAFRNRGWVAAYRRMHWKLFALQLLVATPVGLGLAVWLLQASPTIMGLSVFSVVTMISRLASGQPPLPPADGLVVPQGGNIWLAGSNLPVFGLLFCILLALNLPQMALTEEKWFREGTSGWANAVGRSVIFGFVHMAVGVPLMGALVITLFGLFYSYLYFRGGVTLSAQGHFQQNLILIGLVFIADIFLTLEYLGMV